MEAITGSENLPTILNGRSLVTMDDHQPAALPMPVNVAQIVARVQAVQEIVNNVFKDGVHFGEIPGTAKKADGTAKKVLWKPGFDTLCLAFQFSPEFVKQPESVESDTFISIVYKCKLIHIPTGRTVATGDGACNSKEEKYRWTTAARTCPQCKGEFIRTSKPEDTQGFYCWKKLGGCGATFPKNHPPIVNQPEGRKENDNPWNFHNTLLKMAQKRAGMAAIITACGLSGEFTQDLEDSPDDFKPSQKYGGPSDYTRDVYNGMPQEKRDQAAAPPPEEHGLPMFNQPPQETVPEDVAKAIKGTLVELLECKTKEDFAKITGLMKAAGGAFLDPRVTALVNDDYRKKFPTQKGA